MGTYCYTLRKPTKTIHTMDGPIKVPTFEFAFKPLYWATRQQAAVTDRQLLAAEKALAHHAGPDGTTLALDGEWLVRTRASNYLDGYEPERYHVEVLGRVITLPNGRRVFPSLRRGLAA